MKLARRAWLPRRASLLSAALALAGLATVTAAASPAYATSGPQVFAYGGPEEVWVYGTNFPAGATVRVEVLSNPGWKLLDSPQFTTVDTSGHIDIELGGLKSSGPVFVMADLQYPYGGTYGAQATVYPPPGFLVGTSQPSCGSPVNVDAYGFMPYYNVRVELLTEDLTRVLGTSYTSADSTGQISDLPVYLNTPYTGWVRIVADEYGYGPLGLAPAPATVWSSVYVC